MPKLVCEKTLNGVTSVRVFTTAPGSQGAIIKQIVGAGNPFWIWNAIPPGTVVAADFTGAPLATNDVAQNNALAAPTLADPPSVDPATVLTYAP